MRILGLLEKLGCSKILVLPKLTPAQVKIHEAAMPGAPFPAGRKRKRGLLSPAAPLTAHAALGRSWMGVVAS